MDEVFVIDAAAAEKGTFEKLWSWRAKDREELPLTIRKSFGTTDECKPVDDGKRILISSSGGACAVVEQSSGKVLWYARVPNAHSLEMLPRDRVVAASSTNAQGNKLLLFDLTRSDSPLWETPLLSAHGVVWDLKRERLWALGSKELRCYSLQDWKGDKPSLDLRESFALQDEGGHDLQPIPRSADLVVSTGKHVYLFDRERHQFRPHPILGDYPSIKCVSPHPTSGPTAFVQGDGKNWWNDKISFLDPRGEVVLKSERLYKVRWLPGFLPATPPSQR
jgi:hypothetical protein